MKQQQDSKRKPEQTNPQAEQAGQRPGDLEQGESGTTSQGGRQGSNSPQREKESRQNQAPGGQGSPREQQPDELAQEQDDFGGIGKQDQGGQDQRSRDPSRQR